MKNGKKSTALVLTAALCMMCISSCGGPSSAGRESSPPQPDSGQKAPTVVRISGSVNENHPVTQIEFKLEELCTVTHLTDRERGLYVRLF